MYSRDFEVKVRILDLAYEAILKIPDLNYNLGAAQPLALLPK